MIFAVVVRWVWVAATAVGALMLGYLTREAHRDLQRAKDEGDVRLVLVARISYRAFLSWLIGFGGFLAIGIASLFHLPRPFVTLGLMGAVVQIAWMMTLVAKDARHLQYLLEKEVRDRLRRNL